MIPLSVPLLDGNEMKYVSECIETGWVSMSGAYVTRFEELLAEFSGTDHGVAATNGTCGLHMAMHVMGVGKGDEVILPNITFIASANSIWYTGAKPVLIDVDPDTWQMDLDLLESYLSKNKRSSLNTIMPVHVLGNMCDMDKLAYLTDTYNLQVIEDASESLGSYFNGKHSGSFGKMGVFSFNGNKIITTGGGGMIVTEEEALAKRAKHLTTQAKVNPDTYLHDEIGYNYRLVNVLAAIGVAQMEQLPAFIKKKKAIDAYYREHLGGVGDIKFQKVTEGVDPNCWLFTFSTNKQAQILEALKTNDIIARPFWVPMNQLEMFKDLEYISKHDHSREIHRTCLSIPSSVNLTEAQIAKVVQVVKSVF